MNKVKTFLWVFVAILALIAVGSFAVQAMPIKTVPPEKCEIEVISDYCTYSFTDSTENVVTEFFVGETYTLNATSDYGYNLQSVSFNNEVVSLPYTFVASVNDFVAISTEPITIVPNVISALSDYSFTNINDEVVTEFTFGETYTITVTPTYCAEFEKIVFNNEIITENSYTFILDTTSVSLEIWSNYSELPYSVSAENCSYYFMDVVGNYPTELKLGTIYTLYANPIDGYEIVSVTLNGNEISLPYRFSCHSVGETFNFVIDAVEKPKLVTINFDYDSSLGSVQITELNGNVVTEYIQNTDYILSITPNYGYYVYSIYSLEGGQRFYENNQTFNTGAVTQLNITIFIKPMEIAPESLIETTNCTYSLTYPSGYTANQLIFGETYILNATANDGYAISSVEYMGETHALPYTFTFNNLAEKFVLNSTQAQIYTSHVDYTAENCQNWTITDTSGNTVWVKGLGFWDGATGLVVGNTYRGMFIPNTNCVFSSLTINGVDSSSLVGGSFFNFVAQEENNISLVCEQEVQYTTSINYVAENCNNWTIQDLDSNTIWIQGLGFFGGNTHLVVGNTYRGMFIPNTNCVFSSLTINGVDSSSLVGGSFFNFVAQEENNISLVCVEEVQSVSIVLNYDSSMCSVTIADSLGTEVTEFEQNANYTIFVTPSYGYMVSSIVWQPGIDLTYNRTFNTGTNETIPIFITCVKKTVHHSSIIEATNCSYKFFDSNNNYVTNLVFGESYTLTATADDGYTISSVEYIGQTYSLPYTFVLNNLELRFTLDASRNEFADFTINYSGLPSGLTANAKILGMEATDSIIMFDIVSESFSSSVTSNVDLNSLSLDLNYFRVAVDDVPYGYEVTSLIVNSVNYEVYESTTNCYLTYSDNLINLSNISYTIDVIFSELTSSTASVSASGCSESSACSVYFYLKNDAEIDIDNNFFNASVYVDAYNGVNGPADFSDYLQHNKFMKIRLVLPYLTNLVSLNATLNNNSISFNCVDSSLGIYESTEVFEFPCKKYELNLYFVLSMATTSIVSSSSNCIYEFTDTDGNVVTSLIVGNEYTLNVSPIDGYGSLVCTYAGQDITNPYTFTLTDTSGRFVFSASE